MPKGEGMVSGSGEDYSVAATIVPFYPPLPLLRGPVNADSTDDPSTGSLVLAFCDAASWRSAFWAAESKIVEQCEAGARAGCSIRVSNKCRPYWWKKVFGMKPMDFAEREKCEEHEMSSCMASAKDACIKFAKEKCWPVFQEARISTIACKKFPQLVFWAPESTSETEYSALEPGIVKAGFTDYNGSELMMGLFS